MKGGAKAAAVVALGLAVAVTLALRDRQDAGPAAVPRPPLPTESAASPSGPPAPAAVSAEAGPGPASPQATPRILELGSNRCFSCQEMAKVLDALRASQGERLQVEFIDVFDDPEAAERHEVKIIPLQILYDGRGREIYRHTGYFAHDDILAKFRELGVAL